MSLKGPATRALRQSASNSYSGRLCCIVPRYCGFASLASTRFAFSVVTPCNIGATGARELNDVRSGTGVVSGYHWRVVNLQCQEHGYLRFCRNIGPEVDLQDSTWAQKN